MDHVFLIAALVCVACVVFSLFGGLIAMAKGTKKDNENSNKMMRLRVLFQGLAIVFLFMAYLAKS